MSISLLFCGLAVLVQLVLGALVLAKGFARTANRIFSLQLFLFMLWSLAEIYLILSGINLTRIKLLLTPGILLSYFFCVFSAVYPDYQKDALILRSRFHQLLFLLPAVAALYFLWSDQLISTFSSIPNGFTLSLGGYEFVFKGIIISYLLYSLSTLSQSRKSAETKFHIRRLKYTFAAMLLPVAAGSIIIAAGRWFIGAGTAYSFGLFPVLSILMSSILAYTMLKYNLMDIDLIFSIGLVYTLLTAILAGFMELMEELMQELLSISDIWTKVVSVLLIAGLMSPLKDLLVKFVDHFFGKKAFDSVEVMQKILAQMRGCENLEKIFARMLQELQIVLEFDSYYLAVEGIKENSHLESEEIKSALQRFPVEDLPKEHNDIDAAIDHFKEKKEPAKLQLAQSLKLAGIRNYFILQDEKKSYGFLLLGAKKTRVPFSEAELNLVNGICHEAPYIIENLKMINKLLQQSRSLQEIEWAKTMLEAIAVKDELLEIGALKVIHFTSLSSEIKGDLIDYSKNNGRSSVGVYDAFHHGIQAVLTLNILFSVFRTSKDADSRFIMANQILRNFSEQKLCSAATLLAADQRNLELAIAGNPAPIIIAGSATRQIQMPESEPLGLAKNLKYSKLEHELQPGEIMLVATNGLFKAFTGIVGTDLPEFLQNHHFSSARDCREKILQKIGFKAMTKFSDDITFVLVS